MSLLSSLKGKGPTGFGYGSTAEQVTEGLDLSGKRYLVTGVSSGLGAETARVLALRGATVVGLARSQEKADAAVASLGHEAVGVACELADPASVRAAVGTVLEGDTLDGIIANAGIMALPKLQQAHGYELQFFTNHIGHFLLVTGLLGHLRDGARVVMLSSAAHQMAPQGGIEFENLSGERAYTGWRAYGQAKLSNLLFARELSRRLEGSGKTANAVHPGVIATNLGRHMNPLMNVGMAVANPLFMKSIPEGAATQVYVAVHPDAASVSGEYWADCNLKGSSAYGRDLGLATRLWERSEAIAAEV
ncbi:MAG: SDR family oxidoreductase [Deltaproteobacteria bacterium]|nr:SDR family oxidoreductase [Deltaproteobacteria bacterium]